MEDLRGNGRDYEAHSEAMSDNNLRRKEALWESTLPVLWSLASRLKMGTRSHYRLMSTFEIK